MSSCHREARMTLTVPRLNKRSSSRYGLYMLVPRNHSPMINFLWCVVKNLLFFHDRATECLGYWSSYLDHYLKYITKWLDIQPLNKVIEVTFWSSYRSSNRSSDLGDINLEIGSSKPRRCSSQATSFIAPLKFGRCESPRGESRSSIMSGWLTATNLDCWCFWD